MFLQPFERIQHLEILVASILKVEVSELPKLAQEAKAESEKPKTPPVTAETK